MKLVNSLITTCLRESDDRTVIANIAISSGLTVITARRTDCASLALWVGVMSFMITSLTDLNLPLAFLAAVMEPTIPP